MYVDQKEVAFMWVSGQVGIPGNETADRAAKEALDKELTDNLIIFSDLNPSTAKYIDQVCQKEWHETVLVFNKLHAILPSFRTNYYHFVT